MASGADPDAPDWFEPEAGDDDLELEGMPPPETDERSKESTVVHIDDLSPDDVRGGATTADSDQEVDIIEASREDDGEPSFSGDIPGFTDWREELRERLKRIRARREQERADEELEEQAAAPDEEQLVEETPAAGETEPIEEVVEETAEAEPIEDAVEEIAAAEHEEERAAAPATAGDIIAKIVDGPGDEDAAGPDALILGEREATPAAEDDEHDGEAADLEPEAAHGAEVIAFSSGAPEAGEIIELDLDAEAGEETAFEDDAMVFDVEESEIEPEAVEFEGEGEIEYEVAGVEGEGEIEYEVAGVEGEDEIAYEVGGIEAEGELEHDFGAADEPVVELPAAETEIDDTLSWSEVETTDAIDDLDMTPAAEEEEVDEFFSTAPVVEEEEDIEVPGLEEAEALLAAQMPEPYEEEGVPELEFDEPAPVYTAPAPEIDLAEEGEEDEDHALEWDEEEELVGGPRASSSAAPLGERAAAAVCDGLVLTALGVALVGAASSGAGVPFRQIVAEELPWIGLTWAIFAFGYSVFLVGACGQTIGRMVMRVRVVGDDQFSVGFGRAAKRLGFWVVSALPLLAGMLPALRDPQKRALHDRLSHTRVVKA